MKDLVNIARKYATKAHVHLDHRRKYSLEPYSVHLQAVVDLVASVTDDQGMIAAAWLHDTVEDTAVTLSDLEQEFGYSLAQLVGELTDVSKASDGNRVFRKSLDCAHLAKATPRAKTIKLADLINNCQDSCAQDPEFAKVYLMEMALLLEVLQEGDRTLFEKAMTAMHTGAKALNLPLSVVGKPQDPSSDPEHDFFPLSRMAEQFRQTFTARNITRTLPSVDHLPSEKVQTIKDVSKDQTLRRHSEKTGQRRLPCHQWLNSSV